MKIPQYKKIWYSITKFERYPEMATEGVGRAFLYLISLMIIFSIIVTAGMIYKFNTIIKTTIVDTNEVNDETLEKYKQEAFSGDTGIIVLKDRVMLKADGQEVTYNYKDFFNKIGISDFNEEDFLEFVTSFISTPQFNIAYFLIMLIYAFITYFLVTLMDVLVLSIFGMLTGYIAKIKIRYRAVFNMSVYAITISVILKLIYTLTNIFTNFEIKYFDLMYTAIAYICLTASIFMIKSDVIKQQIELIKIMKKKEEEQQKEQPKEQQEEQQEEKKEEENKEDEKDKELDKGDVEEQGSNA